MRGDEGQAVEAAFALGHAVLARPKPVACGREPWAPARHGVSARLSSPVTST